MKRKQKMKCGKYETASEFHTRLMLSHPITPLARLIGRKWFLPIEKLVEKTGVSERTFYFIMRGDTVSPPIEKKIRSYLETL